MKTIVFKPEIYNGCKIYFRQIGADHFEYLVVIRGEIYTAHLTITPTAINRLLYLFKIEQCEFSQQQYDKIIAILRRLARTTVETILKINQKNEINTRDKSSRNRN